MKTQVLTRRSALCSFAAVAAFAAGRKATAFGAAMQPQEGKSAPDFTTHSTRCADERVAY